METEENNHGDTKSTEMTWVTNFSRQTNDSPFESLCKALQEKQ